MLIESSLHKHKCSDLINSFVGHLVIVESHISIDLKYNMLTMCTLQLIFLRAFDRHSCKPNMNSVKT